MWQIADSRMPNATIVDRWDLPTGPKINFLYVRLIENLYQSRINGLQKMLPRLHIDHISRGIIPGVALGRTWPPTFGQQLFSERFLYTKHQN